MSSVAAEQDVLKCPNCAGQCAWSPKAGALTCASCGVAHKVAVPDEHDAAAEFSFNERAPENDPPLIGEERTFQCQGCGGEVLFIGAALSEHCPYCNGAVVLGITDMGYRTKALIPFRIEAEEAQRRALGWVKARWAAPRDLARVVSMARVAGLYAPFWTFDSNEAVRYWAKYTTGSGDNRRTHSTSGKMDITFDDLLMPASPHVTPLIRDGILHDFRPYDLKPYMPQFLAGFAAERHHQSVAQGLSANRPDKDLLIRNRIKGRINKRGVHAIRYQTDTTGIHYRRILLPVWILHYEYGDAPMKVVVSGIDGRTFGERPFSTWKMAGLSALLSGAALLVGWAWGAAGFL